KINKAKKGKSTLLAQTVYLGTLGFVFVLPIIAGAYLGVWLDEKIKGYSMSWTINLILLGVIIGAINVYLLIKD
ncbi:TPA: AtpZ/AtpI family protein, partial [Legionella pneumophila]